MNVVNYDYSHHGSYVKLSVRNIDMDCFKGTFRMEHQQNPNPDIMLHLDYPYLPHYKEGWLYYWRSNESLATRQ